ncbi:MAG TPA: acyl-ACP--UDP-N-acetylglucosamine O-acyltransferase [Verrucomicrobiae bacterium]|jgi:UDP-N-acetylglucosamine acyltransferase|nr:acyl-ACP--UDP-N-acetylglucosamine O-acyltransferase [Verrucomicrobiae bacterium]
MTRIHPTAVVAAGAQMADDVEIGAYCCIGAEVSIEPGVRLHPHVVVAGRTHIGAGTEIHPFASLGQPPQYVGFNRPHSGLEIGRGNVLREYVTMNGGTSLDKVPTHVGSNCYFMTGVHIAHDCWVGDSVTMANNATLGGHVVIGDHVNIGGLTAIHQYCRVGKHAMVGGCSAVTQDVVPFAMAVGNRARLRGLNVVGLKRRSFSRVDIQALRTAYRQIFLGSGPFAERLDEVSVAYRDNVMVMELISFITADATRPIAKVAIEADD